MYLAIQNVGSRYLRFVGVYSANLIILDVMIVAGRQNRRPGCIGILKVLGMVLTSIYKAPTGIRIAGVRRQ
jgi:hypothetical protein